MNKTLVSSFCEAVQLLQSMIQVPSFSKEEKGTADLLYTWMDKKGFKPERKDNNVWARNKNFDPELPTILLNSHHDTVRPVNGWTKEPFSSLIEDNKLYGLGSNDAGGCVAALLAAFFSFYKKDNLPFNLIIVLTAEEEISGLNGIESVLPELGELWCAIVGEPTGMQMAVAEKGLLVLDCIAEGKSGHAAREAGVNAIYKAVNDIEWFRNYRFPKVSDFLGEVKMTVTQISAGTQHNVIPDTCRFTVDIRITEEYTHGEILEIMQSNISSKAIPRSGRLRSSMIPLDHPLIEAGMEIGLKPFGSPTSSDKALLPVPALKMGPGDSRRSHTADEYIFLNEIEEGIKIYIRLLETLSRSLTSQKTTHEALAKEL